MEQQLILERMETDLKLRNRAPNTLVAYRKNIIRYLGFIDRSIDETDEEDIRAFIEHLIEFDYQPTTTNNYLSSVLFMYEVTLNRPMNRRLVPFMKIKEKPVELLNREEIAAIFESTDRLDHRSTFMLAYSAGLRLSEIRHLRTKDLDSSDMRIHVTNSKRSKSRYTLLSPACLDILRAYWKAYRPDSSEGWVFPKRKDSTKPADYAPLQKAFGKALNACNIKKNASFHTLRACFATHLLETGVDLFVIKELMGHASIISTVRYLHLANVGKDVTSPLDTLIKGGFYV